MPDGGTINGVGQWGGNTSSYVYSNYTLLPNTTYRIRLINAGSFAAIQFSVDDHVLTVVEADGTVVEPYRVSNVRIDVAQRYSVLLTTDSTPGAFWMRATVSSEAFTVRAQPCPRFLSWGFC